MLQLEADFGMHSARAPSFTTPEGYTVCYMKITPEIAKKMLERNIGNRNIKERNMLKIKADMIDGKFYFNGDAIRIAKDGTIIDGQHRLTGVVDTGISIYTLVVLGLPDEVIITIDEGVKRNLSERLKYRYNTPYACLTAAVLVCLCAYEWRNPGQSYLLSKRRKKPERVYLEYYEANMERITQTIEESKKWGARISFLPDTQVATLYELFHRLSPDHAAWFFDKLETGEGLEGGHPILVCRNALMKSHNSAKDFDLETKVAMTIKSWNACMLNKLVKTIRWNRIGPSAESFPQILNTEGEQS